MKIVALSDTHGQHEKFINLPQADIIIHTGDFSTSSEKSFYSFIEWFSSLNFKYKIFIGGNHDKYLFKKLSKEDIQYICSQYDIIYLEDSSITIEGIKFYGSPWSLVFGKGAFMGEEEDLEDYFDKIPLDTEILLTHTPPYNILDLSNKNLKLGSISLYEKLKLLKNLKFHFFGHVHEGTGIFKENNISYINSAINEHIRVFIVDLNKNTTDTIIIEK